MKYKRPLIASLLTFLTVGLGHVYAGAAQRGLLLFITGFTLNYLAILASSYEQLLFSAIFISITGIGVYLYAILDVIKYLPSGKGVEKKWYSNFAVYLLFYLINSLAFSPFLIDTFTSQMGKSYSVEDNMNAPLLEKGDFILATEYKGEKLNKNDIIVYSPNEIDKNYHIRRVSDTGSTSKQLVTISEYDPFSEISKNVSITPDQIIAKAQSIYWSWDKNNKKVRWEKIDTDLTLYNDSEKEK